MTWYKVDDGLPDNRKTRHVRRSHPTKSRDAAPFGIWVLAGAWCGKNPTHGFVPLEVLQEWDDDAVELADRLVKAGLWHIDDVHGELGYRFHDYADRNPVDADDPSTYGRRGNHIRWHEQKGVTDPECAFCRPDDRPDVGASRVPESSRPVPTRPDPTKKPAALRASDLDTDPDFVAFWKAYPRRTDKGHARKAWLKQIKDHDPTDIIVAAEAFAVRSKGTDPKFIPHPATWLNGERWTDETPKPTELTDEMVRAMPRSGVQWSR